MASTAGRRQTPRVTETDGPEPDGPGFGALDASLAQLEAKLNALQSRLPDGGRQAERSAAPRRVRAVEAQRTTERARAPERQPREDDALARLGRSMREERTAVREERDVPPQPAPAADAGEGRFAGALTREIGRMRSEMSGEMHQRFEELGREISTLRKAVASDRTDAKLEAEFDRVYDGLEAVATALDRRGEGDMARELETLRREVSRLAAEDTLHAIGRGQDELARRLMQHHAAVDPEIASIRGQIDELATRIEAGDINSLKAVERRIAGLSQSIEVVREQTGTGPDLTAIEARLDDIARGVVAASQSVTEIDTAPFERLEARLANQQRRLEERDKRRDSDYADTIAGIAKRLEFVNDGQSKTVEATNRIAESLTERFDAMAAQAAEERERSGIDLSPRFEQIANHVEGVNQRVDDWGKRLDGWGQRLTDEARRPREAEVGMFKALASRLDAVSDRLSQLPDAATDEQNWAALEARMAAVLGKLDRIPTDTLDTQSLEELRGQLAAIAWRLEQPSGKPEGHDEVTGRLDALAERIDGATAGIDDGTIARIGEVLGERLTGQLEDRLTDRFDGQLSSRLADLTEVLHRTTAPLTDIGPRMDALEESMGDAQVTLVDTARSAAEEVVKALLEQGQQMAPAEVEAVHALDEDVKRLEELTRSTDERNTKTFDAVHDTLMTIVERLDALDGMVSKATQAPDPAVIAATHAALMQQSAPQPASNASLMDRLRGRAPTPAAAPASAAAPAATAPEALVVDPMDAFEGLDPDTPLEPETGQPSPDDAPVFDPTSIAAGVQSQSGPSDPASDFLMVARRKAQAVAAEAAFEGVEADGKGKKGKKAKPKKAAGADAGKGDSALSRFRRPLLLAAAVAITAALVLPNIMSTVGGVVPADPVAPEPTVAADIEPETFGEVAAVTASAGAGTADAEALDGAGDDMEVTEFTVPVETIEAEGPLPDGTDGTTTRSIDPTQAVEDDFVDVGQPTLATAAGPVEDLTFGEADGPAALVAAAEEGDPRALFEIASRSDDAGRAFALYRAAAERGLAPAQYRVGQAYEKGRGVATDKAMAKQWYVEAAEAGNTSAMHNLAVLYAMGASGPADPKLAGEWFTRAATYGVKDSQYNLGILHAQGSGVAEDLTESYKWFDAAAKAGDPEAGVKRDEVAGALPPSELEAARAKAAAFRPQSADMAANRVSIPDEWRSAPKLAAEDMTRAVRNVQAILNKNGFDAGVPDGVMGKKTRTAILQFQEAAGLPRTGQIDDALVKALLERNT